GSCIISGRSDATLNRGGVRLGTAELYGVVEALDEVTDSLAVYLEGDSDRPAGRLVLFVVTTAPLDEKLRQRIAQAIRERLSPRHVPDEIYRVGSIPRTLTGKKVEVPVKRALQGEPLAEVATEEALTDPTALRDLVSVVRP